ncbi:MAG: 30S ribosomal protein S3 [Thermomicrobia bacterium]|nr:30S ribosomal protein S3 [Thermomicrobia bacterium]MCA1724756.1 30S ribosomal protein S3 [Thermomicrobia bacterium]MDQ2786840.1 30S ribosomal protein S3 [Chloroflexota bacterium]
MGRKVNPIGFRLGIVTDWDSRWFAERNYTQLLHEDIALRRLVMRELPNAGIARIHIERAANKVDVTIYTAKPGIVIGKQGSNVEKLRNTIKAAMKRDVHLKIEEIKTPELEARLVAENIADQLTRRVAYRRAMKHAVSQSMRRGAKGVKVRLGGRLGGAEMSRTISEKDGRVPLHTLRANIDYAVVHAHTTYGRIGVKVWIYKGDVIPERRPAQPQRGAELAAD